MKIFVNRDDVDFSNASDMKATQEFQLANDNLDGIIEYPVQVFKFGNVHHLTLYITCNWGASRTRLTYIGFKGLFTVANRDQIVITNYELKPNPAKNDSVTETNIFKQIH